MKFIDALKLALLKKLRIDRETFPVTNMHFAGQHTNPAKRTWRDLKARIGARQARRQTRKAYANNAANRFEGALHA